MVDGIGRGGSAARDAILAAIKNQSEVANGIREAAQGLQGGQSGGVERSNGAGFAAELKEGLGAVQHEMRVTESLPEQMVTGKITDFHEVAVQLKKSDLSFRFALQVRNKLIDAYREVMRMNV